MSKQVFAVVRNDTVVSFITEESQKTFLLQEHPDIQFFQFEWNSEKSYYPSDFTVENGQLVRL